MATPQVQRCIQEGMTHHQAGRSLAAYQSYAKARLMDPLNWEAHQYGGMASLQLGRNLEAVQLFARALELNPKSSVSAVALGLTQLAIGEADAAEKHLRIAVKLDPRSSTAWDNLGLILKSRGSLDEALVCAAEAVKTGPKNAMAWVNQGVALLSTPRVWDALASFERALRIDKTLEAALGGRAICLYRSHRTGEASVELGALFKRNPQLHSIGSHWLMSLNNLDSISKEQLWGAHQAFGKAVGPERRRMQRRDLSPGERLRVGFLSCDLKAHSVSYFLKPLLEGAAEAGVDVFLYHDNGVEDSMSATLKGFATVWRNMTGQLDEVVEKRILEDGLDILVDLAGHTGANRLGMLAHRLAPVQISYLGYPNTSGVPAIDFRFVDSFTDPEPEADAVHSEKLVRFSSCAWTYDAPLDAPACRAVGAKVSEGPVFGSFNHATKITDTMMRIWGRLLKEESTGRLLLKSPGLEHPSVREHFLARLKAAGVDLRRTELLGTTSTVVQHLELYHRLDVALDTFPYTGTTTSCEALWMGVPVVTLAGDRHAARVSTSLLHAMGRTELIAYSSDEYVAKARTAAQLMREGKTYGEHLRQAMRKSVLLDHVGQAQRFWTAIKTCAQAG